MIDSASVPLLTRLSACQTLVRDAAAGIKREPWIAQQPVRHSSHIETVISLTWLPRTKPNKPTTTTVAPQHETPLPPSCAIPLGLSFANPEIFGEPPEADFQPEDADPKMDPRYTGKFEDKPEDPECLDPEVLEEMSAHARAVWLGRWFAQHYGPWVTELEMEGLATYELNPKTLRDSMVGPLPQLYWTFRRFCLPETVWRKPPFWCSVRCSVFQTESPLTPFKFRMGLKRFRSEVVSTLHTYATRIFGISDITTRESLSER